MPMPAIPIPLQSEKIDLIAAALVAAQGEMDDVPKNANNSHLGTRYANLAAVRSACLGALNRHGIAVTQTFAPEAREPALFFETIKARRDAGKAVSVAVPTQVLGHLRTQLTHVSGQWIASDIPVAAPWGDAQTLGGMISYLRRYALASIAGLATEDDDGHSASSHDRDPRQRPERRPAAAAPAPAPERGEAFDEFEEEAGPRRLVDREDRKSAYRDEHPPAAPAQQQQQPRRQPDGKSHAWPPKTGRGLYAAVADSPARKWFDDHGSEKQYPERFAEWTDEEVAAACRAYDFEMAASGARSNGHAAAGARK